MEYNTIATYIIIDDILKQIGHQEDKRRSVNDSMILTTAVISAWYFGGNWRSAISYMKAHHCKNMLSYSRFCRRIHQLKELGEWCFNLLGWVHKELNHRNRYVLDTFPVAVCHNIRISRCRLLQGEEFRGYNASKREYFYGFKVALLVDESGNPIELAFYPAGYSDHSALHRLDFDLPKGSIVYQDSGFTDYQWEDYYKEYEQIEFATARKKGSKKGDTFEEKVAKSYNRKIIETTISQITNRFPKRIHAVIPEGFQLKLFMFIFSFSIIQFIP